MTAGPSESSPDVVAVLLRAGPDEWRGVRALRLPLLAGAHVVVRPRSLATLCDDRPTAGSESATLEMRVQSPLVAQTRWPGGRRGLQVRVGELDSRSGLHLSSHEFSEDHGFGPTSRSRIGATVSFQEIRSRRPPELVRHLAECVGSGAVHFLSSTRSRVMNQFLVPQSFVGLLYQDGAFARVLEPGKHRLPQPFFKRISRKIELVDLRERSLTLKGQEILTADKVAIRVSLLVYFKVVDPVAALHNVAGYEERIYEDVQLAARRFLANRTLEAILSDRNEISDTVREDVRAAATGYGVAILRADVKDLVFPGNLREIMNQVLETERRAEAEIIRAKKDAESARIKAEAARDQAVLQMEHDIERARRQADVERARAKLDLELGLEKAHQDARVERERAQLKLALELEQATALRQNPELLKLRELQTLTDMAHAGGRFAIGLRAPAGSTLLGDGESDAKRGVS
ncbi:MAG: hypothetical protein DYH12_04660 [Sorangiineae bacterium PRO1]|nr:hypothetical protein [Sorangiineae bacterium PRO1]